MPNGSHPMHMVLRPRASTQFVVYCRGPEVRVIPTAEWDELGVEGAPVVTLDAAETAALVRFIDRWLELRGETSRGASRPNVEYDF